MILLFNLTIYSSLLFINFSYLDLRFFISDSFASLLDLQVLSWDSSYWFLWLRVLIFDSNYYVFPITLTDTELWVLYLLFSYCNSMILFSRLSMILSLSSTPWTFGLSFCHLKYLSLNNSFSLVMALNLLSNNVKNWGSFIETVSQFGMSPSEWEKITLAPGTDGPVIWFPYTDLSTRLVIGSMVPTLSKLV